MTLYEGRFHEPPDEALRRLNDSLPFDRRLWRDDLDGSVAHVGMLEAVGLVAGEDATALRTALAQVRREMEAGTFHFAETDEDIHTAVERRVTELAGDAGRRVHTGRSRNDQVATDMRLYLRRAAIVTAGRVVDLQAALVRQADAAGEAWLPAYTHMQRAQVIPLAHHLLAYVWMLGRDVERFQWVVHQLDESPLGAGAAGGTSLPIDPDHTAHALGFSRRFQNSLDAVASRDQVAFFGFAAAQAGVTLSRLCEEIVLWASAEFGFVRVADRYSTGSSMLPQKRNPDVAELGRAKAARLAGDLVTLLGIQKALPLAYNKDLQEDKEASFDAVDTLDALLPAVTGMVATLEFVPARMQAGASDLVALDLAEHLVGQGVPFRDAHAAVARLVRDTAPSGLGTATAAQLAAAHPTLGAAAAGLLDPVASLAARRSPGGGGWEALRAQRIAVEELLAQARAWLESWSAPR